MADKRYIFGYGSLVNAKDAARTLGRVPEPIYPATLKGWVREWGVVIDNTEAFNRCIRLTDGRPAPGHIAVLNVRRAAAGEKPTHPNGVLFEVTEADLKMIDERETHYARVDVTQYVVNKPTGRIYVYTGNEAFLIGGMDVRRKGRIVIPGDYHEVVRQGFASLGQAMLDEYLSSTLPSGLTIHRVGDE